MAKDTITLSHEEIDRISIIRTTVTQKLKLSETAQQLHLSIRQVKRLVQSYRREGDKGLVSKRRGKPPNNAIDHSVKNQAMGLLREKYSDFSPTFAHEKLTEIHGMKFSVETLRKWMISTGTWQSKSRKKARIHQRRPRRSREGELIQIDGSPHAWFEDRGPFCTLIVFIDDATSRLKAMRFSLTETTQAYMETLSGYLVEHGRPVALYSDKHSIFRVNRPTQEGKLTQFSRALKALDIEPIHASSPQAKGRVERANQTLQDRLVKELRLQCINSIEAANSFLPEFIEDYNARFGVAPQNTDDTHRKVLHTGDELKLILCQHHTRKLTKNLALQFKNTEYQLKDYGNGYSLRGAHITLCESYTDGTVTLCYNGKILNYRKFTGEQTPSPLTLANEKTVSASVEIAQQKQQQNPTQKRAFDYSGQDKSTGSVACSASPETKIAEQKGLWINGHLNEAESRVKTCKLSDNFFATWGPSSKSPATF